MKMIIRNCPCFVEGTAIKGNEQKTQTCNNHKVRELTLCEDCTDCVMKQIYEMCKSRKESSYSFAVAFLVDRILQLLQVEEV